MGDPLSRRPALVFPEQGTLLIGKGNGMQLGINLGYWGAGMDTDNLAVAREADRLGYAVVLDEQLEGM